MRKLFKVKRPGGGEYPEWHFRYLNEFGKLKAKQGFTDRQATLKLQREALAAVDKKKASLAAGERLKSDADLSTLITAYLAWGRDQGRRGRVWSEKYRVNVDRDLRWWLEALGDKPLAAFHLIDIEAALIARRKARGDKGLAAAAEAFRAFLRWCIQRQFRASLPPEEIPKYDKVTKNPFRNLTLPEIFRLFAVISRARARAYRVALITGARRNELGTRRARHMDWSTGILTLEFGSAKSKKAFRFWLPEDLVEDLREACAGKGADTPLFESLSKDHAAKCLQLECAKAGIPIQTEEGRVVFHSLRVTFITELLGTGADPKTVQTLARHGDPRLTFNVYGKIRHEALQTSLRTLDHRLQEAIEGRQKSDTRTGGLLPDPYKQRAKLVGATGFEPEDTINTCAERSANASRIEISAPALTLRTAREALAHDEATKKRHKDLARLFAICEALSPFGLDVLLETAELALANETAAKTLRRPA